MIMVLQSGVTLRCLLIGGLVVALSGFTGCSSAPDRSGIAKGYAGEPPTDTDLARWVSQLRDNSTAIEGVSGVHLLGAGTEAYAARLALIAAASESIDVQYYLFHQDATGTVLTWSLWQAAERGVKVRLLLDDLEKRPDDFPINILDAHPNIEVRLYNPFYRRSGRALQMLGQFARLNHRMHNKSLTADNLATVVGGRNVGDEYFDANKRVNFGDLDVLAVGPVVSEVSSAFDRYWNSELVYPYQMLTNNGGVEQGDKARAQAQVEQSITALEGSPYADALVDSEIAKHLKDASLSMAWAPMALWVDKPDLVAMNARESGGTFVIDRLLTLFGNAEKELFLVSPYFVPRNIGTELLTEKAEAGVKVTVVTNALAATDVVAVHSGYAKRRKTLLKHGVNAYEIKASPDVDPKAWSIESNSSLHAKTFVIDRRWVFVGSFNLDPRSAWLNTEMGILIDSPKLAETMLHNMQGMIDKVAYKVELANDDLVWIDTFNKKRYDTEPNAGWWRRFSAGFMSFMPVEAQL